MLRLAYLAILYWWYGGSLSSLPEEVTGDSSDQHQHNATATGSAADNTSEGNGAPEGSNTSPAPASGSQLQQPPTRASAAQLGNARRGVQLNKQHIKGASSKRDHDELQKLLKRVSIKDKLTALTVLTSIVSDLDLFADWYFFKEGLQGESRFISDVALAFAVVGTVMYVLVTVEFHFVSKIWTMCRGGEPLNPLQHVPLGWQLLLNVLVEDIPQLVITWITSPTSVAGVLNIATAGFALMAKTAEGFESRRDLPVSALLRMVEEDPGIVRHMVVRQREAEEQATNGARLAVLVNEFKQVQGLGDWAARRRQGIALGVMQIDPGFLNGKLNFIREKLEVSNPGLSFSQLIGPIPPALGSLTGLEELQLWKVELTGDIPSELGKLGRLMKLDLDENRLEGPIPTELGNLTALTSMHLARNKLSGRIPAELGNLSALTKLHLHDNKLNGRIPAELGNLSALTKLHLHDNKLNGTIPPELGGLTALQELGLPSNQLTGTIPPELGRLTALWQLDIACNQLRGTIPPELGGLTALKTLSLWSNQLTGTIPPELGELRALERLSLSSNQLTGSIPGDLRQLKVLRCAWFEGNSFSGTEAEIKLLLPAGCDVQWDLSKDSCMSRSGVLRSCTACRGVLVARREWMVQSFTAGGV